MTAVLQRAGNGGGFAQIGRRRHGVSVGLSSLSLLLLFAFLSGAAEAQPSPNSTGYGMNGTRFNPSMAIIVVVLISVFFVMGFFSIYIRQCTERGDLSINRNAPGRGAHGARSLRGLDPAVIETFPVLVYADVKDHKIGKGGLECAVCLSEFDGGDMLRLLPKCDHVFHTNCIDAWLSAHTTCPVCRADLVPDPNEPPPIIRAGADADADGAAPTATSDERQGAVLPENPGNNQSDQVVITIDEAARPEPAQRKASLPPLPPTVERATGIGTEGKGRSPWWSKSSSSARAARLPRSHSTGHSMTVVPPAADCDRYTLRLPEHIRRDVMAGKLRRSSSFATFPATGDGSVRKGYGGGGGEGSSRGGGSIGGRSFKLRRPEWAAKPDRWSFFAKTFSTISPKGGDSAGEGSTRRGAEVGDQPGDASVKAKPFATVRSPFDCLGVGGGGGGGGGDGGAAADLEDARRPLTPDHSSHG